MNQPNQSVIMPYHRNKAMLLYTTSLLEKMLPSNVEIIVIGNNSDKNELEVELSPRVRYEKIYKSMLYSATVNMGVEMASGDIITLCDQDIFGFTDWYTPLLNKLLSNNEIGAVSSKLLNPTNNRIIDFGIEYSLNRVSHTYRGHFADHPLTLCDRKVTSSTSATLMMRKDLYTKIGGMDIDMPYCCSDCDIGFKVSEQGYQNWVIADSVAYHKGSSSSLNGKSQSFSYLARDSHTMFWAKNYHRLKPTVTQDIKRSFIYLCQSYTFQPLYCFINLSTLYEFEWYSKQLQELGSFMISDCHSYKVEQMHYSAPIQIYDSLPYTFMNIRVPIIYFVDYFPSLQNNQIWCRMRDTKYDIVLDSHGNIVLLDDIVHGCC